VTVQAIRLATDRLYLPQPLPQRLAAAYDAFELVHSAVRGLAYLDHPEPARHGDRSVLSHTVQARSELARAPTFSPPTGPPPHLALAAADKEAVVAALIELSDALVLALLEAAAQAHQPADATACRQAAIHACYLRKELYADAARPHRHHGAVEQLPSADPSPGDGG
jgi:hypothetical protein